MISRKIYPLIATISWIGTLIALFVIWLSYGAPEYQNNQTIAYISDVGAKYPALFIAGCSITAIFFTASMLAFIFLPRGDDSFQGEYAAPVHVCP